jgi:hypothetical protein
MVVIQAGLHEIYLRLPHPGLPVSFAASLKELDLAAEELSEPRNAVMRAFALARGRGWILVTCSFRFVGEIRSIIENYEPSKDRIPRSSSPETLALPLSWQRIVGVTPGQFEPPQKSPKNRSAQVPPRLG